MTVPTIVFKVCYGQLGNQYNFCLMLSNLRPYCTCPCLTYSIHCELTNLSCSSPIGAVKQVKQQKISPLILPRGGRSQSIN